MPAATASLQCAAAPLSSLTTRSVSSSVRFETPGTLSPTDTCDFDSDVPVFTPTPSLATAAIETDQDCVTLKI